MDNLHLLSTYNTYIRHKEKKIALFIRLKKNKNMDCNYVRICI